MTEYDPKLVERMVALVRGVAAWDKSPWEGDLVEAHAAFVEACAIVAELPAPVDPYMLAARKSVAFAFTNLGSELERQVMAGQHDSCQAIQSILAMRVRVEQQETR